MFNGMGAPGMRVTGRMDRESEFTIPILQTLAKFLVGVVCVLVAFVDLFLIQPTGYYLIVLAIVTFLFVAFIAGGKYSFYFLGEREVNVKGIRDLAWIVVAIIPYMVFLYSWTRYGEGFFISLWYLIWPAASISVFGLVYEWVCIPCIHPSLLFIAFFLACSYFLFKAAGLLNFRFSYEITDPNWPPTITQVPWQTGPYGPDWRASVPSQDDPEDSTVAKRPVSENGGTTYSVYTPPPKVSMKHVLCTVQAIYRQGIDPDNVYWWPGEGTIEGVSARTHRRLQDDWINYSYASKASNNHVFLTDIGVSMMKKLLHVA